MDTDPEGDNPAAGLLEDNPAAGLVVGTVPVEDSLDLVVHIVVVHFLKIQPISPIFSWEFPGEMFV